MNGKKVVAIIQARMGSRRFPGKVLAHLCGKPVLQHVIEAVRRAKTVHDVIVATAGPRHREISVLCSRLGVSCFCGAVELEANVLGRFVRTLEAWPAELVVRVCADNPLIRPILINQLVQAAVKSGADYTGYRLPDGRPAISQPNGYIAEVVKSKVLMCFDKRLVRYAASRAHVTAPIYHQSSCHSLKWLNLPDHIYRLPPAAIDTLEDLERVRAIIQSREQIGNSLGKILIEHGMCLADEQPLEVKLLQNREE